MQPDEHQLWENYKKTGSRELLDKLVTRYLDLVYILANKLVVFTGHMLDKDELYSAGVMGLLEAIERYDPTTGFEFKTFAGRRIRGAIIDEIRRHDWVPRSVRRKSRRIDTAVSALYNKLGRMPTDSEVATELGLDMQDYYNLTDKLGPMFLSSLDEQIGGDSDDNLHLEDVIEDSRMEDMELTHRRDKLRKALISAIAALPEKEKLVIALYYYEELTLKEIGEVLHVSESRVCQIHSSAIFKLRGLMLSAREQM